MIQIQQWYDAKRILVVDERHHGSVQVCIPAPDYEDSKISGKADALIYAIWVDEPYRRQGSARLMLEAAEHEAKKLGCKSVCLNGTTEKQKTGHCVGTSVLVTRRLGSDGTNHCLSSICKIRKEKKE